MCVKTKFLFVFMESETQGWAQEINVKVFFIFDSLFRGSHRGGLRKQIFFGFIESRIQGWAREIEVKEFFQFLYFSRSPSGTDF